MNMATAADPAQQQQQQHIPLNKHLQISTRLNSQYKWQSRDVIGALEVPSEPYLNLRASRYLERTSTAAVGNDHDFQQALQLWNTLNLQADFVAAATSMSVETSCCGLVTDDDKTLHKLVPHLTRVWIPKVNEQLLAASSSNIRLDLYVWSWHNAMGKSETNILLIRFHRVKTAAQAAAAG